MKVTIKKRKSMASQHVGVRDVSDLFVFSPGLVRRIKEKASKRQVAIRLENWQIDQAKRIAQKRRAPYQSLMRQWIEEGIERSLQPSRA